MCITGEYHRDLVIYFQQVYVTESDTLTDLLGNFHGNCQVLSSLSVIIVNLSFVPSAEGWSVAFLLLEYF